MNKILKYIYRGVPLFIFLIICLAAVPAHASWWSAFKDAALDAAGRAAAAILGIDTEDNCTPPTMDSTTCLFCPMFKIIFNASSLVAAKSYQAFSSELGQLILVFLSVSLALIILRNIAAMGSKDPSALLNDIFKKTFVCIAIYIIITQDYYNILNLTLTPIFETGFAFVKSGSTSCANANNIIGYTSTAGSGGSGGLPMAVGTSIVCAVEDIERKINTLFEFGEWAFCLGNGPNRVFHLLPNPIFIIDAIILYIAGIFFMVTYPWIMGDAVLQFGISTAILPFAVCGYAFSGTKSYLSKVFSWLLNSLFVFMFMAILILCILGYIGELLGAALTNGLADPEKVFSDPNQGIAFYGPNMLKIIFILVIGWAYMPAIADLAEQFAGGSGLSAAGKIGAAVRNTIDEKTRKAADWGVGVAGNAAKTAGRVTQRRVQAGVRRGIMAGVNTFGKTNTSGGKSISFAGMKFQTQRSADGSQVLRREFTSITGRRHVMISDKYSTIKKEYARGSGREIKSEVKFKHGFMINHLIDESTGKINVGAVQTLLNSPLAQTPEYKKALMSQLAVEIIKKKTGKDIGAYYYDRHVQFDPNDPYNLHVEQKDNTGKTTSFGMKIDPTTGQVAVQFHRERDRNRFEKFGHNVNQARKRTGRSINIAAVSAVIQATGVAVPGVGYMAKLPGGLVSYTAKVDGSGQRFYEREARKYLFFGPKTKKIYDKNGVEIEQDTTRKYTKHVQQMLDIQKKISASTGAVPNSTGGETVRIGNKIYASHVDAATGDISYTKAEVVSGNNLKVTKYYKNEVVVEYQDKNGNVLRDGSGAPLSRRESIDINQKIRKDITGTQTVSHGSSSTVINEKYNAEYETIFDNGLVNISTSGYKTEGDLRKGAAKTVGEKTIYKFSEYAQKGHDHFADKIDGNQIIENDGTIARDMDPAFAGLDGYKGDLLFGLDDLAGVQTINGQSTRDYVRDNILKKGRIKKTNKLNSDIDWTMDSSYIADRKGNIIGRMMSDGNILDNQGNILGRVHANNDIFGRHGYMGTFQDNVIYDAYSHETGHII